MTMPVRVGTRRSELARTQARSVATALEDAGFAAELVEISTEGDRNRGSLASIGGTGVFVNALREALFAERIDVAVHSFKDLPTAPAPGLVVAAVPPREDPRDVLVGRDGQRLDQLTGAPVIGTGSPRRAAQLRRIRDDVKIADIRGNVDTRLRMVADGEVDAVALAYAGLSRLGRQESITQTFAPHELVPAPAQGALALECRAEPTTYHRGGLRADLYTILTALDHTPTRAAVTAERAVLATLQAGCAAPVGAFAETVDGDVTDDLRLHAIAAAVDGSTSVRLSISGPVGEAEELGRALAADMLAEGASRLIEERVT